MKTITPVCKTLRLILGDQLNAHHPWFDDCDDQVLYVMAELRQEATYARHHIQKVTAFFAAMKTFATALQQTGHRVVHLTLDETSDYGDLPALLDELLVQSEAQKFGYQRPDEYRLLEQLSKWSEAQTIPIRCDRTHHFLLPYAEIKEQFPLDKSQRMEHFYRRMRKRFNVLMDDDKPEGGQWNYDAENRKKLPESLEIPEPHVPANPVGEYLARVRHHGIASIGTLGNDMLSWPVSREQSLDLLEEFIARLLPNFGDYQDALTSRGWALFHSRLSFSLNTKMVSPEEVINAVADAWRKHPDTYPLSSVEGFVRQILGWREFVRGIYWSRMPGYATLNKLNNGRELPDFYWSGDTRMACMAHAIKQSLEHAYAHHIQRLMITGNFALLAGVHPDQVDEWYLGIYIDAIEWVEMPNTRGMSQFADGGLIASKPYVSSGNYINKMSNHCKSCFYDVSARSGERSCPFNSLYWNFMNEHRQSLENNPRTSMIYRNWDRMDNDRKKTILDTAKSRLVR